MADSAGAAPWRGTPRMTAVPAPAVRGARPAPTPLRRTQQIRPQTPSKNVIATLLAVGGVRAGAVVLDLTPAASLVRPAAAAAGRSGVVIAAPTAALAEGLPGALRAAVITNAFATLPGSRVLTALRPILRAGARVAVTAVNAEALQEACTVAAYDLLHLEEDVDGVAIGALRARQPS
jgi:hypothetical protein